MMSTVQEIAFLFSSSAKRKHQFQETLKETPESQVQMGSCEHFARLVGYETRRLQELTPCVLLSYHLT